MDRQGWTTLNEEQGYSLLINEKRIAQTGAKIKFPGRVFLGYGEADGKARGPT